MKNSIQCLCVLLAVLYFQKSFSQTSSVTLLNTAQLAKLNERVNIPDSSGKRYSYTAWNSMIASGRYGIKLVNTPNQKPLLVIGRLNKAERNALLAEQPKPTESLCFKTGEPFKHFKETDYSGIVYDTKQLAGKIVVINFCDTKNMACLRAMTDMNELAETYKYDNNIVFLAVPTGNREEVQEVLKTMPSRYHFMDKGKSLNDKYAVQTHPTVVVLNQNGAVEYHSTGYSLANAYWVGKAVEQLRTAVITTAAR